MTKTGRNQACIEIGPTIRVGLPYAYEICLPTAKQGGFRPRCFVAVRVRTIRHMGSVLGDLCSLYGLLGQVDLALSTADAAMAIALEFDDRELQGSVWGNKGLLLQDLGRSDEADSAHRPALEMFQATGNRLKEGIVTMNLASLCGENGRTEEGEALIAQATSIHSEVGNRRSLGAAIG